MYGYENPLLRFLLSRNELKSQGRAFDYDFVWRMEDFFTSRGYLADEFTRILDFLHWAQNEKYSIGIEKTELVTKAVLQNHFERANQGPVPFKGVSILMPEDMIGKTVGVYIASNVSTEQPFDYAHKWTLKDYDSFMFIVGEIQHWEGTQKAWRALESAESRTPSAPTQG